MANNQGTLFHFSWWKIVGIIVAMISLLYMLWKIRKCYHRCKAKKAARKAEEEAKCKAVAQSGDSRLKAIALSPIQASHDQFEDLTGKFEKWNNDRLEEITEKIDKVQTIVETAPEAAAAQKIIVSTQPTVAEQIAQMPHVTFKKQAQPAALRHFLAFGDNFAHIPTLTLIDNGRPHQSRGRRL